MTTRLPSPSLLVFMQTLLLAVSLTYFNRAWYTLEKSILHAQTFDLHRKSLDASVTEQPREVFRHVWCSLHLIESILTTIMRRPRILTEQECISILQSPAAISTLHDQSWQVHAQSHHQSIPGMVAIVSQAGDQIDPHASINSLEPLNRLLESQMTLDVVMSRIISRLYQPRFDQSSWILLSNEISSISVEMRKWASMYLPEVSQLEAPAGKFPIDRDQIVLYLSYKITVIFATWPCLRVFRQASDILDHTSEACIHQHAFECVRAAIDIANLLPDDPDLQWLNSYGPWWLRVHLCKVA